jgi:hypothetical protein
MVAALLITNAPRDRSNWTTEAVPVFMPTADEGNRGVNNLSSGFGIRADYFPFFIWQFSFLIFDGLRNE